MAIYIHGPTGVTASYVDAVLQGLDIKNSVRAATTANIALTGTQTIDGVVLVAGNRVLVKDQSTGSQNGIYDVAAGAWSRSSDSDTSPKVTAGVYCWVTEGTVNGDNGYVLTTNDPIVLGTTPLVFTQFNGAGQVIAGTNISKSGNTLSVVASPTFTGVTVSGALLGSGGVAPSSTTTGSNIFTAGIATSGPIYGSSINVTGAGPNTFAGNVQISVADGDYSSHWNAATGHLRLRPYTDATFGAVFDALDATESTYKPITFVCSSLRLNDLTNGPVTTGTGLTTLGGDLLVGGKINTGAPTSGTSGAWKLGVVVTGQTLATDLTKYIQVDIGGTLYKVLTAA